MYTYGKRSKNVFSKDNTLSLDDKEVDELVDIPNKNVKSLARDGVVAARSDLSGQTLVEDNLANNLSGNGHTKNHPRNLETPSEDVEVSSREDEGDDGEIGDSRGA